MASKICLILSAVLSVNLIFANASHANTKFSEIDGVAIWCVDGCSDCREQISKVKDVMDGHYPESNPFSFSKPVKGWPLFLHFTDGKVNVSKVAIRWDSATLTAVDATRYYEAGVHISDTRVSWKQEDFLSSRFVWVDRITLETNLFPLGASMNVRPDLHPYDCRIVQSSFYDGYVSDYKFNLMEQLMKWHEQKLPKRKF